MDPWEELQRAIKGKSPEERQRHLKAFRDRMIEDLDRKTFQLGLDERRLTGKRSDGGEIDGIGHNLLLEDTGQAGNVPSRLRAWNEMAYDPDNFHGEGADRYFQVPGTEGDSSYVELDTDPENDGYGGGTVHPSVQYGQDRLGVAGRAIGTGLLTMNPAKGWEHFQEGDYNARIKRDAQGVRMLDAYNQWLGENLSDPDTVDSMTPEEFASAQRQYNRMHNTMSSPAPKKRKGPPGLFGGASSRR